MAIFGWRPVAVSVSWTIDVGKVAHIREHPDFGLARLAFDRRLELAVDRELHVALMVRQRRDSPAHRVLPSCEVKRCRLLGMNCISPRSLRIESGPAYQTVKYFSPGFDWLKLTGASSGRYVPVASSSPCGGFIELTYCGQFGLLSCAPTAGAIEYEIVLQQHVPDRDPVLRDDRQVAVRASDGEQADEPV